MRLLARIRGGAVLRAVGVGFVPRPVVPRSRGAGVLCIAYVLDPLRRRRRPPAEDRRGGGGRGAGESLRLKLLVEPGVLPHDVHDHVFPRAALRHPEHHRRPHTPAQHRLHVRERRILQVPVVHLHQPHSDPYLAGGPRVGIHVPHNHLSDAGAKLNTHPTNRDPLQLQRPRHAHRPHHRPHLHHHGRLRLSQEEAGHIV
mmetsp:Transcript_25265/g.58534  ORF Transcript_25265/g.58534 Transcript_25265/m.58534 type:complete len:200 (-) Transcript_25265:371-970(-)